MKAVSIGASCSNSGKTSITLGLARALKNRGLKVVPFKCGPDYIDREYLELAAQNEGGNLDLHLQGKEGVLKNISKDGFDFMLVEGAMGYFDGSYNSFENSCYDISKTIDIPSILVYRPKGELFSMIPKIKGMIDFSENRIKGLIINDISDTLFERIGPKLEEYLDVKVLGHLPNFEEFSLPSQSLGLVQGSFYEKTEEVIEGIAGIVEKYLDIDGILDLAYELEENKAQEKPKKYKVKIAIARDEAFSFHYRENLEFYKNHADVVFFSPLKDKNLPECDLVIIGGGYPENFKEELSNNTAIHKALRDYYEKSGRILAYGGGFAYLSQDIDGKKMVGIFKGSCQMTNRLQNFGYSVMEIKKDCLLGKKGVKLPLREFHKLKYFTDQEGIFELRKLGTDQVWTDGYQEKNTLGFFAHFNTLAIEDVLLELFERIESCI